MKSLLFFMEGFLAKIIAGADDTLTHTPLISLLTKTKEGKFIFISGMFTSILILIAISIVFANLLQSIPYKNIISALLLLILAAVVYCNRYIHLGRKKYFAWAKRAVFQRPKPLTLFGTGMLVDRLFGFINNHFSKTAAGGDWHFSSNDFGINGSILFFKSHISD